MDLGLKSGVKSMGVPFNLNETGGVIFGPKKKGNQHNRLIPLFNTS
tara:strand:- start:577 stop:714 length:138 start_codon:yes stop_codon:yes gene_type:complete